MKILPTLSVLMALGLSSCTLYLKDLVHGSPPKPSYEKSYRNARAEGLDHDSARRRALMTSREAYDVTGNRRKQEEKERKEKDRKAGRSPDRSLIKYRWD